MTRHRVHDAMHAQRRELHQCYEVFPYQREATRKTTVLHHLCGGKNIKLVQI